MSEQPVILAGLGFTAKRLAPRLLATGRSVFAATRNPERFAELRNQGLIVSDFSPERFPIHAVIAHTIPPHDEPGQTRLHDFLLEIAPTRIVYVSATSVYGELATVTAESPAVPSAAAAFRRFAEEQWIENGPWSSLILRAAAIYGPGRGAHRRVLHPGMPADSRRRGPSGVVSRIHVDDLVALVQTGLDSALTGAFPVADEEPCSTESIMRWSAEYLGLDPNQLDLSGPMTTGRDVEGIAICRNLGVSLSYPNYQVGIPHCLREEVDDEGVGSGKAGRPVAS